jgi:hypothetical protein
MTNDGFYKYIDVSQTTERHIIGILNLVDGYHEESKGLVVLTEPMRGEDVRGRLGYLWNRVCVTNLHRGLEVNSDE